MLSFDFIHYSLLLNLAALILYSLVVRRLTCFGILIAGTLVLEFIQQAIEFFLKDPSSKFLSWELQSFFWYFGFAVTDFLFVWVIYITCRYFQLALKKITIFILFNYLILGILQLVRLVERHTIDSDIMGIIYRVGVEILIGLNSVALMSYVVISLVLKVYNSSERY